MRRLTGRGGGRTSTASHLEDDFNLISTGVGAEEFYGIPLSSADVLGGEAPTATLVCLALLLLVVLSKPAIKPLRNRRDLSIAFWTAVAAAACALREVALYPLVRAVVLTRTSYPWLVVLPHCVMSAAAYRTEKTGGGGIGTKRPPPHYLCSFGLAFFCYGFGGSIVSDVLMGLPATALGNSRIVPCWIVGWALVWHSPRDVVYRLVTDGSSFAFHFMNACEAVDGVTTTMGRVSRSARELSNKGHAPILAGILAGCGGGAIRYAERVWLWGGGEGAARTSRDAVEAAAWTNLWYAALWWYLAVYRCEAGEYGDDGESFEAHHCEDFEGNDTHRFVMVAAHVAWYFGSDLGLLGGNPFERLSRHLRNGGFSLARSLQCEPQIQIGDGGQVKLEKND